MLKIHIDYITHSLTNELREPYQFALLRKIFLLVTPF